MKSPNILSLQEALLEKYPNVEIDLSERSTHVVLNKIIVPKEQRGQGLGGDIMQEICDWCDEKQVVLALSPSLDHGATSKKRLESFYKNQGFIKNLGSKRDYEISESMRRAPSAVRPNLGKMTTASKQDLASESISKKTTDIEL